MSKPSMKLFIKSWCGWCEEAMDWLDNQGYKYEKIDIGLDDAARREMVKLSHQSRVPTLVIGEEILPDFDTQQLEKFLKNKNISAI